LDGLVVGLTSAFGKPSDNGDVGEMLEGDITAASDWQRFQFLVAGLVVRDKLVHINPVLKHGRYDAVARAISACSIREGDQSSAAPEPCSVIEAMLYV
jgi:hypothetical protein